MSTETTAPASPVEDIKLRSDYLRGTLITSLADSATGALAENDTQLSKFHGFYQQDDRDLRSDRARRKLEPAYSFMIRVRVPGGIATPAQWLTLDALARRYGNHTLRLTTRQAFQLHGVLKRDLKATIRAINASLLDTIAACGDVNRNVMCTALPEKSAVHAAAYGCARSISERLTPRTSAYHEIWLEGRRVAGGDTEPLYGPSYLPRKFKIAIVVPPANDVDVFAQDLGFIAIERGGELAGFNVTAGGGMGMTHGDVRTYPRIADTIGFCMPEQAVEIAEQVVALQRDFGDRSDRKHARLKYTIDDRGRDWFVNELETRLGYGLQAAQPYAFLYRGDEFGWATDRDGRMHLTLFVPQGRVSDDGDAQFLSGLREIAHAHTGRLRLTANQNLILSDIAPEAQPAIERLLTAYGIAATQRVSRLRQQALACVALPTCGLAMAEAERFLPELCGKIEALLARHHLRDEALSLRITGCPNGCARPYLAEVALVGKAPGRYNLFLGGNADGTRLNRLFAENVDEDFIYAQLDELFARFVAERHDGEGFGDFVHRAAPAAAKAVP